jgi:hypothetical protein
MLLYYQMTHRLPFLQSLRTNTTLFLTFSVVLYLMLLLLILPTTLNTNHSKHVETSYIVLQVDI